MGLLLAVLSAVQTTEIQLWSLSVSGLAHSAELERGA